MDFARALIAKAQATTAASVRTALRPASAGGAQLSSQPHPLQHPQAAAQPAHAAAHRRKMPVAAHRGFALVLGVWGAVCGALCVVVLPGWLMQQMAAVILPPFAAGWARPALVTGAATLIGVACYAAGLLVQRAHRKRGRTEAVQPIDPARELGSASFDAPLPAKPAPDQARFGADIGHDWPTGILLDEAAPEPADDLADAAGAHGAAPMRELDLAEFAALPGRNAVWVDDVPQSGLAPVPGPLMRDPAPAAIEKLRAVPPAALSLCEMVERFAAALQDYQAAYDADPASHSQQQREAVLGEALKALAVATGRGARAAHASAHDGQNRRGAAA